MGGPDPERTKHREVHFRAPPPAAEQAYHAAFALRKVEGVLRAHSSAGPVVHVSYDLTEVSLQLIECLLIELGFHLDNSLLAKLKRALYYYTEQAEQETLGCQRGRGNCTQAIFINRYQHLQHGCRDDRPDHWRHYR